MVSNVCMDSSRPARLARIVRSARPAEPARLATRRFAAPELAALVAACLLLAGCGGRMPRALADGTGRLAPCPASPNCVSSEATDEVHSIAPLRLRGDADAAWKGLAAHLATLPRVEVVKAEGDYLHAVFTTRLMRYRDDVELALDRAAGTIRVRSASRVGYGDIGVNRERIESIRAALAAQGLVEPVDASKR